MASAPTLLAMFQGAAKLKDVKHNLAKMREQTLKAKQSGAQIISFPELFLTGYCLPADDMMSVAQAWDGEAFQELSALAKETGVAILYGYPESVATADGVKFYNSAQLIDKEGKSLVNHQKVHLWTETDDYEKVFTAPERFSNVAECCGLKIGILICYDVEFPEAVRTLAMRGANVVVVPTAVDADWLKAIANYVIPARAYENGIYVAYVNHTGTIYAGGSICCSPTGECIVSGGSDEELLFASIDLRKVTESTYLRDRRPLLYEK